MSIANTWFSDRIQKALLLQLQQSEDQSVRDNIPELYKGRKWKVAVEASIIDSRIKMSKVKVTRRLVELDLGI